MSFENYIATCPLELQPTVKDELSQYGAINIKEGYKAISFAADLKTAYQLHLKLSTVSRILRVIRESSGSDLKIISHQTARVDWQSLWPKDGTFLVEAVLGDKEHGWTSNDVSKAVRAGIENYFSNKKLPLPKVDLKNPTLKVVAFLRGKRLILSLDSSGKTLHKRGYRQKGHPAPIKETLAAACLRMMGYDGSQVFYDPMCGSGTIPIEATYISLQKAPLIHRKKDEFGFENLKDFDRLLWREVQDELRNERQEKPQAPIYAADLDEAFVQMAKDHALRARVEKYINFRHGSFFQLPAPSPEGLLLTNLPYGERLQDAEKMDHFYKEIGDYLKQHYQGWRIGLIAAEQSPYKLIGLKPSKKISILNGSIPCKLLIFDIYAGSKKAKKQNHNPQEL